MCRVVGQRFPTGCTQDALASSVAPSEDFDSPVGTGMWVELTTSGGGGERDTWPEEVNVGVGSIRFYSCRTQVRGTEESCA